MTRDQAEALVALLAGLTSAVAIEIVGEEIVMSGATGRHGLAVDCSDPDRVVAHYLGFCSNNGLDPSGEVLRRYGLDQSGAPYLISVLRRHVRERLIRRS